MRLKLGFLTVVASACVLAGCTQDGRQPAPSASIGQGLGFFFLDEGPTAKLAYGEANSDNVGLMLECAKGSRVVEVTDAVRSSPAATLTLASAGDTTRLPALVEPGEGAPIVVARAPSTAPALAGFRRSGRVEVSYAGLRYAIAARPQERASVDRFFAACEGARV
jgi:hypothetical protein